MENKIRKPIYKKVLISCMCLLIIFSAITFTGCSKKNEVNENQKLETNKKPNAEENTKNETEDDKVEDNNNENKANEENENIQPTDTKIKFVKHKLQKSDEPEFATKFINSINNKLSASIEGRGPDASEEGVGKIFVKELSTGEKWALEIVPGEEQNTPKSIEWIDDDNIVSIIGLGYGTVSVGGDLYKINVKTGEVVSIYNTGSHKKQVISVKKNNNKLELQILVYDDEELIKTHTEIKTINIQ